MIRVASNKTLSLFKNCSRWFCAVAREHDKQIFQQNVNEVEFDWNFLTNEENRSKIQQNITIRKGIGNIDEVVSCYNIYIICEVLFELKLLFRLNCTTNYPNFSQRLKKLESCFYHLLFF